MRNKFLAISMLLLLFAGVLQTVPVLGTDGVTLTLSDNELMLVEFTKQWGPGTLTTKTDIAGSGVQFDFTGLQTGSGTGVGDNFPVNALAGGANKDYGSGFAGPYDFSGYSSYVMVFKNLGGSAVTVNIYMNTGWTAPPWGTPARNTYWQNAWTGVGPEETKVVKLDFSSAQCYGASDDPDTTWQYPDGTSGVVVRRLDEVSNIGFQILGSDAGSVIVAPLASLNLQFDTSSSSIVAINTGATLKVDLTCEVGGATTPVVGAGVEFSGSPSGLTFTNPYSTDSSGEATATITPSMANVYTVTATFCGVVSDTWTLVVYDTVGMTAGGGWYYPLDDGGTPMEGRASFGFVAKYIKGKSTGNLEFQYHASTGFNLKSIAIDYLVITGGKLAQFGGTATKDGVSGYYFRVKAFDYGEPGVGVDEFWIKIWVGGLVEAETTEPMHSSHNTLSGGNIMVKPK